MGSLLNSAWLSGLSDIVNWIGLDTETLKEETFYTSAIRPGFPVRVRLQLEARNDNVPMLAEFSRLFCWIVLFLCVLVLSL